MLNINESNKELIIKVKDKAGIISLKEADKLASSKGTFNYFKSEKKAIIAFTDLENLSEFTLPSGCSHAVSIMPRHFKGDLINNLNEYSALAYVDYKIVKSLEEFNKIVKGHTPDTPVDDMTMVDQLM